MRNRQSLRKRLLCITVAVFGVASVAAWLLLALPSKRIDASLYLKIRPGMAEQDVEAVLGCPAHSTTSPMRLPTPHRSIKYSEARYWHTDLGVIQVLLKDDGRVAGWSHYSGDFDGGWWPRTLDRLGIH